MVRKLRIENFKAFKHFELDFDDINILVGPNNAGKTSVFHALQLFFYCVEKVVARTHNTVYWSSTTDAAATANVWYVDMSNTRINSIDKLTGNVYVWAVRGTTDKLMKTGQTASYASGDDGDLKQGVAWPSPRLSDQDDGTIRDSLTGLVWQKTADTTARNWADSFTYARVLSFASADDWRIPNKRELRSLIHYGESNQVTCLAGFGFTDFDSEYYWTSPIYAQSTSKAFACSLTGATAGQEPGCLLNHERTSSACTIVVRGGE
jgi:hypothetical protein